MKTLCSWRMKSFSSKGTKAGADAGKKRSRNEAEGSAWGSTPPTSPPRLNPNKHAKKLDFVDSKSEDEGSLESLKKSPPQSPREN
jgi:hypothetical protein